MKLTDWQLGRIFLDHPARSCVLGFGAFMVAGSAPIALSDGHDAYAIWLLGLGALLIVGGGLLPWLKRFGFSPAEGLHVETNEGPKNGSLDFAQSDQLRAMGVGVPEITDIDEAIGIARLFAASAAVDRLLNQPEKDIILGDCEWHLYLFDEDQQRLLPVFEPMDPDGSEGWAPGQGATGTAWSTKDYVLVTGAECSDETYGLTPAQQVRYRDLAAVAAMPVQTWDGEVIAVLSARRPIRTLC